jgi:hypothetical protein
MRNDTAYTGLLNLQAKQRENYPYAFISISCLELPSVLKNKGNRQNQAQQLPEALYVTHRICSVASCSTGIRDILYEEALDLKTLHKHGACLLISPHPSNCRVDK